MSDPRVLFLMSTEANATARYRATWPCNRIRRAGHPVDLVVYANLRQHVDDLNARRYDVLVTNSLTHDDREMAETMIAAFRDLGLKLVYDLDDDVVSDESVARMRRLNGDTHPWETLRDNRLLFMQNADLITVSREPLADIVRACVDRPIRVVENAIDVPTFNAALAGGPSRLFPAPVVGWSGARRDPEDLTVVAEAWRLLAERDATVQFIVQGTDDTPLNGSVPPRRLHSLPWVPLHEYGGHLRSIDVGCCSVADTTFGRCKSPIKWFEMALAGVPCVVSETVYGDYVHDGTDAIVARTAEEWAKALLFLSRDKQWRRRIGKAARERVTEEFSLATAWTAWWDAWCSTVVS